MGGALVISRDPRLLEALEASAAAVQRRLVVVDDPERVRAAWHGASVVFVGGDLAAAVLRLALPPRPGIHLVGRDLDEVVPWSVPLQASVLVLPDGSGLVAELLSAPDGARGAARLVSVVAATGGLGASSVAAGLAVQASRKGTRTAVVEPGSGGLDLLLGGERSPGWRWPELMGARGHVGDLRQHLPSAAGVDFVAAGRDRIDVAESALQAVLRSLTRSHELVVLDGPAPSAWSASTVVLVGADVRSVLVARHATSAGRWPGAVCVVRTGRHRRLRPEEVASTVGLPLAGTIPDDAGVPKALEAAEAPGARSGAFGRACGRLVRGLGLVAA